ncbi:LysR family transcriptional regulator [Gordonia malaquae]|uniref:LysR family transcriptional regulator n=1 Tax=Gordonia malaquae TaxID=410332 RepID=UPI003017B7AE
MPPARRPSLDQLRTFLHVFRAGTFSEAASRSGLSQPTVTSHIRNLEEHFGRDVFVRTTTGAEPTVFGRELASQLAVHLDQIDRIVADEASATGLREVVVGGPHEFLVTCLIPALGGVGDRLPRIRYVPDSSAALLQALEAGSVDMVVSTVRPRGATFAVSPIADEELVLVASPRLDVPVGSLAELSAAPFVAFNRELAIIRRYWNTVFAAEPVFDASVVVPDLVAVKAAVVSGRGISVLPRYLVADELRSGRLVQVHEVDEPPINTVFLAIRRESMERQDRVAVAAGVVLGAVKTYVARDQTE